MAKVVIITGATSGIGLATAKLFCKKGYTVYGIARKPYAGEDFVCYSADVCDYTAIQSIFDEIYYKEGHIDLLVNNAGMGIAGAVEDASVEQFEKIVNVNFTALCVLCNKIIPYLKKSRGRIINISSVGSIMPLPYQAMYSATKSGVEIFSRALNSELKAYNVKVCAVLPGDTRTGFTAARVFEGDNAAAKRSVKKMEHDETHGKSPEYVARVIYRCAKKRRPPLRVSVGAVSKLEVFLSRFVSVRLLNAIINAIYG